ncbi:hypothetical protein SDC9_145356 [bioreactor metagenome]|uniref:Uncharacterized protein n=1 Tax=bioreactor metagenome TaxID=1076179 RepID=A0A645EBL4_9ZZZZ
MFCEYRPFIRVHPKNKPAAYAAGYFYAVILFADFFSGVSDSCDDIVAVSRGQTRMHRGVEFSLIEEFISLRAEMSSVSHIPEAREVICRLIVENSLNSLFFVKNSQEIVT